MWEIQRTCYMNCNSSETRGEMAIAVNIGGTQHILFGDVLSRYPETRLAKLVHRESTQEDGMTFWDDYDDVKQEFYFDRDPESFKCIIELYYRGRIHVQRGICPMRFLGEMDFWGICTEYLDDCCIGRLIRLQTEMAEVAELVKNIQGDARNDVADTRVQRCQVFLRRLMDKPGSSLAARVMAVVSVVLTLLSLVVMCVGTIHELQVEDAHGKHVEHPALLFFERVCIVWFTLECVLRFVSSFNKLRFFFSCMNTIDILAILPFYVGVFLGADQLSDVQHAVQTLHILHLARVFKLARHSVGLRAFATALKKSWRELLLLLTCLPMGVFFFSELVYIVEDNHPETMFTSTLQSLWWGIISMSTVGYGDMHPKTTLGMCAAAASCVCGIIAFSVPLHLVINSVVDIYHKQRVLEDAAKHEIKLMELHAKRTSEVENGQTRFGW